MAKWQDERGRWTAHRKLNLLIISWNLKGHELGLFLRRHGLTTCDIVSWKTTLMGKFEGEMPVNPNSKKYFMDKIKKLEFELMEAREINIAQKKIQKILASAEAENMASKSAKKSSKSSKKQAPKA